MSTINCRYEQFDMSINNAIFDINKSKCCVYVLLISTIGMVDINNCIVDNCRQLNCGF